MEDTFFQIPLSQKPVHFEYEYWFVLCCVGTVLSINKDFLILRYI